MVKLNKKIKDMKKKLRTKQQRIRRLEKKVKSLKDVIQTLGKKNLISDNLKEELAYKFSEVPHEMFQKFSGIEKSGKGVKYSPELRSFALTLHFYSVKAYNFVRKNFKLCLPHPYVISQWYSKIPAEPGFTKPSFDALSLKLKSAEKNCKKIPCLLMLDEMRIKKFTSYDGKQYHR